ncbi:MAG: lipopolysaccharide biosynthesis protein [Candidatus Aminicenantales bacterium]
MHKIIRNYLYLIISYGATSILNLCALTLLSRLLSPDQMGRYSMANAVVALFYSMFLSWMVNANVRFGCEEIKKSGTMAKTWTARQTFIVPGLALAFVLLYLQPFHFLEKIYNIPSNWWIILFVLLLSKWIIPEAQSLFQATGDVKSLVTLPFMNAAVVILFYGALLALDSGHEKIILVLIAPAIFAFVLWAGSAYTKYWKSKIFFLRPETDYIKQIFQYSYPLLLSIFVAYLSDWGDHILIRIFYSNHEVGLFQVAYQVMFAILGISSQIIILLLPKLIHEENVDGKFFPRYLERIVPTFGSFWSLGIVFVITFLPYIFLLVVGKKYAGALVLVLIMSFSFSASYIASTYSVLFSLQKRLGRAMIYNAIGTGINLAFSFCFVRKMGIIASAIGTAMGYLSTQAMYLFDQHRYYRIRIQNISILTSIVIIYTLSQIFVPTNLIFRISLGAIAAISLIHVIRKYSLVDADVLATIFAGRHSRVENLSRRFFVKD